MESLTAIPKLKKEIRITEFDSLQHKPTYLIILDERHWQVSEEIKQLIDLMDGHRSIEQIAACLSEQLKQPVAPEVIAAIIAEVLMKRGIMEETELPALTAEQRSRYFWFKKVILKAKYVEYFRFLTPLFNQPWLSVLSILTGLALIVLMRQFLNPHFMKQLMQSDLTVFIDFFLCSSLFVFAHELGHMAGCMKHGIQPGDIGFGFYFTMPVLYSDVTRTWRLKRKERLLVDLGGVYFEGLALAATAAFAYLTGNVKLLNVVTLCTLTILGSLNPFIKMDGYWVFADWTGITNLHRTIREFFGQKCYALFGIKRECRIDLYHRKIKGVFYLYAGLSLVYIGFFAVSLVRFASTFITALPHAASMFRINPAEQLSGWNLLAAYWKIIYQNLMFLISGVAVIHILYFTLKGVCQTAATFIQDLQKHRRADE